MNFDEYLESNLGSFKDDLTEAQREELKSAYDKLLILQNTATMTFEKGINSKHDIDYTVDYEKSM